MPEQTEEKPKTETEKKEETPAEEPSEPSEATEEETPEEAEANAEDVGGGFLSPEALLIFPIAIILDLIGIFLILFGLDDFFITDIIGIVFIGGWTFFRSQTMQVTRGAAARMGKAAQWAKRMKWLRPLMFVGELIPYVGAAPCWTVLVYFELKGNY